MKTKPMVALVALVGLFLTGLIPSVVRADAEILTEKPKYSYAFDLLSGSSAIRLSFGQSALTFAGDGNATLVASPRGQVIKGSSKQPAGPYGTKFGLPAGDWTYHVRAKMASALVNGAIWCIGNWDTDNCALVLVSHGNDGVSLCACNGKAIKDRVRIDMSGLCDDFHDYAAVYHAAETKVELYVDGVLKGTLENYTSLTGDKAWHWFSAYGGTDSSTAIQDGIDAEIESANFYTRALSDEDLQLLTRCYGEVGSSVEMSVDYAGDETLKNFPVLVYVSAPGWANFPMVYYGTAQYNFFDEKGNRLAYEFETETINSGEAYCWVRVPELTRDSRIYLTFGGTGPNKTTDVWSDYLSVWHMTTANGVTYTTGYTSEYDHSANGVNMRPWRSNLAGCLYVNESGQIGKCVYCAAAGKVAGYNPTLRYLGNLEGRLRKATDFSVSGWFKANTGSGERRLFGGRKLPTDDTGFDVYLTADSTTELNIKGSDQTPATGTLPKSLTQTWMHIVVTFSADETHLYANGEEIALDGSAAGAALNVGFSCGNLLGGPDSSKADVPNQDSPHEPGFNGFLDEIRIYNGVVSPAWAKAEYDTVKTWACTQGAEQLTLPVGLHYASTYRVPEGCRLEFETYGKLQPEGSVLLSSDVAIVIGGEVSVYGGTAVLSEDGKTLIYQLDPNFATTAEWNGALDGDLRDAANWTCRNLKGEITATPVLPNAETVVYLTGRTAFTLPAGEEPFWNATVVTNVVLEQDVDWRGVGNVEYASDATVDLNGHGLVIDDFGSVVDAVTFSNSATGEPSTLTLDVPAGQTLENTTAVFAGNLQLVKAGTGTYLANRTGQTYTGGTVVCAGIAAARPNTASDNTAYAESSALLFGAAGSTVTVDAGATLDTGSQYGWHAHELILNGGTLTATAVDMTKDTLGGIGDLALTSDSYLHVPLHQLFNASGRRADLGGHLLTVTGVQGKKTLVANPVANGTVNVVSGVYSPRVKVTDCSTADFVFGPSACYEPLKDVTVRNLDWNGATWEVGEGVTIVKGTFLPRNLRFHNTRLADGAAIDLSGWTSPFPLVGEQRIASKESFYELSFETDAAVTVNLSGRTPAAGERIIAWELGAKPAAVFAWDAETAKSGVPALAGQDGLYYGSDPTSKEVAVAHWTGAGDPDDATDPANWACTNLAGQAVTEALPSQTSLVRFNAPLNQPLDLSALGELTFARDSVVDLNGCQLTIAGFSNCEVGAVVTNSNDGEFAQVVVNVGEGETTVNSSTLFVGDMQLVKDGDGTFVPAMPNQRYALGTQIYAGTLQADRGDYGTNCLGPDDTEIYVGEGATFDFNGKKGWLNHVFALEGGTLANSVGMSGASTGGSSIGSIRLDADSCLRLDGDTLFGDATSVIDLSGYTLTAEGGEYGTAALYLQSSVTGGKLVIGEGVALAPLVSAPLDANTLLEVRGGDLRIAAVDVTIPHLLDASAGLGATTGKKIVVTGTFTPSTTYLHNTELPSAATLDLNGQTGPWSCTSALAGQQVTFTPGATVTVDLSKRNLTPGDLIIGWDERPDNVVFRMDEITAAKPSASFSSEDDGLYFGLAVSQDPVFACWTNASGDGDVANPANWACTNAAGQGVSGRLPIATTTVNFNGQIAINASKEVAWNTVCFNGALAADSDLTGVSDLTFAKSSSLDLNGHRLRIRSLGNLEDFGAAMTDSKLSEGTGGVVLTEDTQMTPFFKPATAPILIVGEGVTFDYAGITLNATLRLDDGSLLRNTSSTAIAPVGSIECLPGATAKILFEHFSNICAYTIPATATLIVEGNPGWAGSPTIHGGTLVLTNSVFNCTGATCDQNGTIYITKGSSYAPQTNHTVDNLMGDGTVTLCSSKAWTITVAKKLSGRLTLDTGRKLTIALKDGVTVDLNGITAAFPTTKVTFPAPSALPFARINLEFSQRIPDPGDYLISWSAIPSDVMFVMDEVSAAVEDATMALNTSGVVYGMVPSKVPTYAYWTGAAGDNNPNNAANWACTNNAGMRVSKAPTADSTVFFIGDKINAQFISSVTWKSIYVNGSLANDTDFSSIANLKFATGSTLDLNGHRFTVGRGSDTGLGSLKLVDSLGAEQTGGIVFITDTKLSSGFTGTEDVRFLIGAHTLDFNGASSTGTYVMGDGSVVCNTSSTQVAPAGTFELTPGTTSKLIVNNFSGTASYKYPVPANTTLIYEGTPGWSVNPDLRGGTMIITNGTLKCSGGTSVDNGTLYVAQGGVYAPQTNHALENLVGDGTISLNSTKVWTITVTKTWSSMLTIDTAKKLYITLADGATIDLSKRSDVYAKPDRLNLPASGTVYVNPPAGKTEGQLISWASAPSTTFALPAGVFGKLESKEDGLYLVKPPAAGAMIFFLR